MRGLILCNNGRSVNSKIHQYLTGLDSNCVIVDLDKASIFSTQNTVWEAKDQDEYKASVYCEYIKENLPSSGIDYIVIDSKLLEGKSLNFSVLLALRLRFSEISSVSTSPIVIITERKNCKVSMWQIAEGYGFAGFGKCEIDCDTYEDIFLKNIDGGYKVKKFWLKMEKVNYDSLVSTSDIIFGSSNRNGSTDRHDIANEWGAASLLKSFGFDDRELREIEIPKTLKYRVLESKFSDSGNKNKVKAKPIFKKSLKKVLLIDDRAKLGWRQALSVILPCNSEDILIKESRSDAMSYLNSQECKLDEFDIVFLDLYLPNKPKEQPDKINAIRLLKFLKLKNAALPVILFTASNKAWNMEKVKGMGADGYIIKASPEVSSLAEFNEENRERITKNIRDAYNKGKILKKVWSAISLVENELINKNSNAALKNPKAQKRTKKMLRFAFRNMQKIRLDKYEKDILELNIVPNQIAFITLWSALNSILLDVEVICDDEYRNIRSFRFVGNIRKDIVTSSRAYLVWDSNLKSYSVSSRAERLNPHVRYTEPSLFVVAFLYAKFYDDSSSDYNRLHTEFLRLKEIRNTLDFTHVDKESMLSSDFGDKVSDIQLRKHCVEMLDFIKEIFT